MQRASATVEVGDCITEDESSQDTTTSTASDEPEEQHLSLFDDKDLVALLLNQSVASDEEEPRDDDLPIIDVVESPPTENLDHVYHKQLHRDTNTSPVTTTKATVDALSAAPVAVTQQLLVPMDFVIESPRPASSLSVCPPQSPFSCSSSSGYDSDHKDTDSIMAWEETFSDLFPDLV